MNSYTHRISDSYVILISTDANFSSAFLNYFAEHYGPHNSERSGFSKVFTAQSYDEALLLFHLASQCYVVVIDNNLKSGDMSSFFTQVSDKLAQQLMPSYEQKQTEADKRNFELEIRSILFQTFLVQLDDAPEFALDNHLTGYPRIAYLQKPVTLEKIDALIDRVSRVEAQWLRDPWTYLPDGRLVGQKIREIADSTELTSFFVMLVGPGVEKIKADKINERNVIHFMADIIEQSVEELADSRSWIGHLGRFNFFIVIEKEHLQAVTRQIRFLFEKGIQDFYHQEDAAQLSMLFYSRYR